MTNPVNEGRHDTPVSGADVCRSVFVACPTVRRGLRQKNALM